MFKPEYSWCPWCRFSEDSSIDEDFTDDTMDMWDSYTLQRDEEDFENTGEYELSQEERCSIYAAMATRARKPFTLEEAKRIGEIIGIDWNTSPFDVEEFRKGMNVELEHGQRDPETNVTGDNPILTGKIALAHLREFPDYYQRLAKLEQEAKAYWMIQE
jgi:hypothetical protein